MYEGRLGPDLVLGTNRVVDIRSHTLLFICAHTCERAHTRMDLQLLHTAVSRITSDETMKPHAESP